MTTNLSAQAFPDLDTLDLANACRPEPGIIAGGCPSDRDLGRLQQAGFQTVLDLRESREWNGDDFGARVRALGLSFLHLPISGLDQVDAKQTRRFWDYWQDAGQQPMLVHCASGNRVGAMLALAAHRHGNDDPHAALARGLNAGLKAGEPTIRKALGLAA